MNNNTTTKINKFNKKRDNAFVIGGINYNFQNFVILDVKQKRKRFLLIR